MQPRFYADENVSVAVCAVLRRRGIDVVSVRDAGLLGRSDAEQFSFAIREKRALITHDGDFLILAKNREHCGILFFTRQLPVGIAAEEIERMCFVLNAEDLRNSVVFLPFEKRNR